MLIAPSARTLIPDRLPPHPLPPLPSRRMLIAHHPAPASLLSPALAHPLSPSLAARQHKDIEECVARNRASLRTQSRQATKSLLRAAAQRAEERAAGLGAEADAEAGAAGAAGAAASASAALMPPRVDAAAGGTALAGSVGVPVSAGQGSRAEPTGGAGASDVDATATHLDFAPADGYAAPPAARAIAGARTPGGHCMLIASPVAC